MPVQWRTECKYSYQYKNEKTRQLPNKGDIVIYYPNAIKGSSNGPDGWHQRDNTTRIVRIHIMDGVHPKNGGYCDVKYYKSVYKKIPYRGNGVNPCAVFSPKHMGKGYWPHLLTTATYQENQAGLSHEWAHGSYDDDNVWLSYNGDWANDGTDAHPKWRRIDDATLKEDADQTE